MASFPYQLPPVITTSSSTLTQEEAMRRVAEIRRMELEWRRAPEPVTPEPAIGMTKPTSEDANHAVEPIIAEPKFNWPRRLDRLSRVIAWATGRLPVHQPIPGLTIDYSGFVRGALVMPPQVVEPGLEDLVGYW